jgi:hypothetical protein
MSAIKKSKKSKKKKRVPPIVVVTHRYLLPGEDPMPEKTKKAQEILRKTKFPD